MNTYERLKVSVIVTAANTDTMLDMSLRSISEQTYRNIETIVVYSESENKDAAFANSAVNDKSAEKLEVSFDWQSLAKSYKKVNFVNSETPDKSGCRNARLAGLLRVTGDYVLFLRAGDTLTINTVRSLVLKAESAGCDMVICENAVRWLHTPNIQYYNLNHFRIEDFDLSGEQCFKTFVDLCGSGYWWYYLNNKLIRRDLLDRCYEGLHSAFDGVAECFYFGEDLVFSSCLFCNAKHIVNIHNQYAIFNWIAEDDFIKLNAKNNITAMIDNLKQAVDVFSNLANDEKYKKSVKFAQRSIGKRFWWRNDWAVSREQFEASEKYVKKTFDIDKFGVCFFEEYITDLYPRYDAYDGVIRAITSDEIEIVMFDVFDTLILRPFFFPTDLFEMMNGYYNRIINNKSYTYYANIRIAAESEARLYYSSIRPNFEDVNIDEIFDIMSGSFGIPQEVCDKLKEREIELEKTLCYGRNTGYELFQLAKDYGKKILLVSDMYLNKDIIENILHKNGYEDCELWLSNEVGSSKHSGALYKHIISEYKLKEDLDKIIIIGDDYHSEVEVPESIGFKGYHLPKPRSIFANWNSWFYVGNFFHKIFRQNGNMVSGMGSFDMHNGIRNMVGLAANILYDFPYVFQNEKANYNLDPRLIGTFNCGMYLFAIVKWIADDLKGKNVSTIHFVARDGYFLQKAYDRVSAKIGGLPKSNYLFCSRKSMTPLTVQQPRDLYEIFNPAQITQQTPEKIIKALRPIIPQERITQAVKISQKNGFAYYKKFINNASFYRFIKSFENSFYDEQYVSAFQKLAKEYFSGIVKKTDVVFDIGYNGRTEATLFKLLSYPVNSYYIHDDCDLPFRRSKQIGYINKTFFPYHPSCTFVVREKIFLPDTPSCVGYDFDKGEPLFEEYEKKPVEHFIINVMQKNSINFVDKFTEFFGDIFDEAVFRPYDAAMPFEMFLHYSKPLDRLIFKNISLEDDFGMDESFNLTEFWEKEMENYKLGDRED
ncbi:MAG: glycosyltransferase [Clostridiales bacterium]|jgi:glycosyltransferase involved in cell wall biosynthesis/FMN phosphatase YigB (HAD superfamily)|nr:glycosyltransferase [Clostridiales bacterium]